MQLAEEVEEPYREKFHKLNSEVDAYRTELNKLKYEHSFLKSEYEHEQEEHQRVLKEMKMRHEAEVSIERFTFILFYNFVCTITLLLSYKLL